MPTTIQTKRAQGRAIYALLAAATLAAATPALAHAMHAPGNSSQSQVQTQPSSGQLIQEDMLGPKYVTIHHSAVPHGSVQARDGKSAGHVWTYATGAAIVAVALVLLAAGVLFTRRERKRAQPDEQRGLAGA